MADQNVNSDESLSPGGAPSVLSTMSPAATQPTYTSTSTSVDDKPAHKQRITAFQQALDKDNLDLQEIQTLSFTGMPESLRPLYWKILLNYLPLKKPLWNDVLAEKRKLYKENFVAEFIIDPRQRSGHGDHPLNMESQSIWNMYFKDNEIMDELDKDVKRTLPHLRFFNHDPSIGSTQHYESLRRILFIYAKLNPGIKYVQGMNEVLGPIYYIFATDQEANFKEHAEADAFFCFTNLMSEIRDNFCKSLDKSQLGITGTMTKLNTLLRAKDPEIWQSFEDKGLNPQFYSFRWLTLLLSQEFDLPDVLRLWDSLFSDVERFNFLLYVCCAMITHVRESLLDGGFAENLKLLQSYPIHDTKLLISKALQIKRGEYVPPAARAIPIVLERTTSKNSVPTPSNKQPAILQSLKDAVTPAPQLAKQFLNLVTLTPKEPTYLPGSSPSSSLNNSGSFETHQKDFNNHHQNSNAVRRQPSGNSLSAGPKPFNGNSSDSEESDSEQEERKSVKPFSPLLSTPTQQKKKSLLDDDDDEASKEAKPDSEKAHPLDY